MRIGGYQTQKISHISLELELTATLAHSFVQQTLSCEKSSRQLTIKANLVVSTVRQWYLILLKVKHTAVVIVRDFVRALRR